MGRELGHLRLECIVLCNLGIVHDSQANFDEARDHFEAALVVARKSLEDRRSEGQVLTYRGRLHTHLGDFDAARHCFNSGEMLLHAVSDRMSLGILLCVRAEMEHLAGSLDAARVALAQAGEITASAGVGRESELGLALARARGVIGASDIAAIAVPVTSSRRTARPGKSAN